MQHLVELDAGPVNHRVTLSTVAAFFQDYMAVDVAAPLTPADWLTIPQQKLRTVAAGSIYHDDIGLTEVCARFAFIPTTCASTRWRPCGRASARRSISWAAATRATNWARRSSARLVHDVMQLCFLQERAYAPYPKWFGTAFARLDCADAPSRLWPPHWRAHVAGPEAALAPAYETVARQHNALGVTPPLPATTRPFFGRPWQVIALHGFADALVDAIADPAVAAIARRTHGRHRPDQRQHGSARRHGVAPKIGGAVFVTDGIDGCRVGSTNQVSPRNLVCVCKDWCRVP
ncbi:MAG: DUF4037 domain-containing protein [Caldilineaceae bacterium]